MTEPSKQATPLPCPFCGGEAASFFHRDRGMGDSWHVECQADDCGNGTCHHETEAEAIAAWNTRPRIEALKQHAPDALLEALEKIAEGDEPRPTGKSWFPDGPYSKHDQCVHGAWMYETCGNCVAEYARAALKGERHAD